MPTMTIKTETFLDSEEIRRTPKDKGNVMDLEIRKMDTGLWTVNGTPCNCASEVQAVVAALLYKLDSGTLRP